MSTAADTQPGTWITVGVLVGLALALLVGVLLAALHRARAARADRAPRRPAPDAEPSAGPVADPAPPARFEVDDLPGFLESPPGSAHLARPVPAVQDPPTPPTGASAAGSSAAGTSGPTADRGTTLGVTGAAALLVAAVVVALVGGGGPASPGAAGTGAPASPAAEPTATADPAPATDAAPGAAAWTSVPLGRSGIAVSASFGGVVLEQRAVGVTVTYPSLSVTTDGSRSLAHLRLPTFNCLTAEAPADPASAGCARSLVEYADLAGPDLRVARDGERIDVTGLFPTYLRSNGSAPAWTGRAYQLSASTSPAGPVRDGQAAATGVVRLGLDSAESVAEPGVNVLLLPR